MTTTSPPATGGVNKARVGVQRFGTFLSGMIMPNIAAFIAWGFITMLFGSVAASIVELADCPVAVIPPRVRSTEPESVVCPDATDLDDAVSVSTP